MQALGYHRLGDLYTAEHRVIGERALKERTPTRKGVPGLGAWLARHNAVLVPRLRAPTPRWQAAPKDWVPGAIPAYPAEAVIGGQVAKTTKDETVYHSGFAVKVTTAMKDPMEAENWAQELRVCCQPPDALPSDTRLHRLVVALLGVQVQVNAPLQAWPWDDHQHVLLDHLQCTGVTGTLHRLAVWAADGGVLVVGADVASPPGYSNHSGAAVAVGCHRSGRGGKVQIPRGVRGAQVLRAPVQGATILLAQHGGYVAGRAPPSPEDPRPRAPKGSGPCGTSRPGHRPPSSPGPKHRARYLVP